MDTLTSSKIGALLTLFALTLAFGAMPYFLVLWGTNSLVVSGNRQRILKYLNCFGGGVFLGALLLHLMVEGSEEFEEFKRKAGIHSHYPFFNLLVAAGFFIVAVVEYLIHDLFHARRDEAWHFSADSHSSHQDNVSGSDKKLWFREPGLADESGYNWDVKYGEALAPPSDPVNPQTGNENEGRGGTSLEPKSDKTIAPMQGNAGHLTFKGSENGRGSVLDNTGSWRAGKNDHTDTEKAGPLPEKRGLSGHGSVVDNAAPWRPMTSKYANTISAWPSTDMGGKHEQNAVMERAGSFVETYSLASTASPIRAFLLVVAFSFHTIFDGLAVGLQGNDIQLWEMFSAIAIHKCIVSFCLGIELFSRYIATPQRAILWISLFALMSPVGICIGIYVTSDVVDERSRHLSSGILQGLAAGTFLYVTFLEILSYYWSRGSDRHFLDILFAMIGFGCMAGVRNWDNHHH